jgi:hypothetical protein
MFARSVDRRQTKVRIACVNGRTARQQRVRERWTAVVAAKEKVTDWVMGAVVGLDAASGVAQLSASVKVSA